MLPDSSSPLPLTRTNLNGWVLFCLILLLSSSCAQITPPTTSQQSYYTISEITYLRASPENEALVLGQLSRGDQVTLLEGGEVDWWQVQQTPEGKTGWVPKALLSSHPPAVSYYYVAVDSASILTCPRVDCPVLQKLSRGEQVRKIEANDQGWLRVQTSGNGILGWLPATMLMEHLAEARKAQPSKEYYYVAIRKLGLRTKPWIKDEITSTLQFNEQVQKVAQNSLGWFKVKLPATGNSGWVQSRYLEPLPLISPRPQFPAKIRPVPVGPKVIPLAEPEIM